MLTLAFIRENKDLIIDRLDVRNFKNASDLIQHIIDFDIERRRLQTELDESLAQSNKLSKEIGLLFKSGETQKANLIKEKTSQLKEQTKILSEQLSEVDTTLKEHLYQLPNIPHPSVPKGNTDDDNVVILTKGELPVLEADAKPHWEIAKAHDIIDFELGTKITGAGFPVYKGKGAKLQRALISYFLDKNTAAGYTEVQPPLLVNEASGYGTGQLPDKEGQMYEVTNDNLFLIPTSEVPLTNLYRNEILKESDFPICNTAYTPCFRREAGSYGAHVRGLNRLHQFDKVEIVRIEHPQNSYQALDEMVNHIKTILDELELPYRILRLCGGDLGFTSALTYDFEIYSAAQKRWLEISSVSNFESFQANRLKLRFKNSAGKKELAHTLNGSALALPRVLAGLLENNQTDQGIKIPEVLVKYTGFDRIG